MSRNKTIMILFQNANLLSAVLCLVKELDYTSLEVVEMAVRCRMEELDDWACKWSVCPHCWSVLCLASQGCLNSGSSLQEHVKFVPGSCKEYLAGFYIVISIRTSDFVMKRRRKLYLIFLFYVDSQIGELQWNKCHLGSYHFYYEDIYYISPGFRL